jgi:hypothetical protein
MTPSQLEHLKLIDAHLERLLAIAEKRTPGEWKNTKGKHGTIIRRAVNTVGEPQDVCRVWNCSRQEGNAAYIASCAGNAEAGWVATRSMIDYLLMIHKHGEGYRYIGLTEDILAAFSLELIQKP